jgi:hypothetical protein
VLDSDRIPRANGSRIRAALEAQGCERELSAEIKSLARALAASKKAGSFLCLGSGAGEIGAWVLDAMDYSSGMVALVQDADEAAVLEREFDRDVRASVHLQDPESFLIDVRAHRFDLIVDLIAEAHPRIVRLGLGALRAGGVYLGCHLDHLSREAFTQSAADSDAQTPPLEPDDFEVARFGEHLDVRIIVRRTQPVRLKRRSRAKTR